MTVRAAPVPPPARSTVLVLGAMVALGPLSVDLYLPALPTLADDLGAPTSAVQVTLSATLIGLAAGQLLMGPISDRTGRRPPVLAGAALHVAASLVCAVTSSVALLTAARFLQGLGASAATVVTLAVVRDVATGRTASRLMSRLILVLGAVPILAPSLGGLLLTGTSWRGIFLALAGAGAALAVAVHRFLPETRPPSARTEGTTGPSVARRAGALLGDRVLVGWSLAAGLATAATFAYVAGSPFVLQDRFGMGEQAFGLAFGVGALWLIGGAQASARLVARWSPAPVMIGGLLAALAAGGVLVAVSVAERGGVAGTLLPLWVVLAGAGMSMPNAPTLALAHHGDDAGAAAAIIGALRYGVAALAGPLVGLVGGDAVAMAAVIAGSLVLALVVAAWARAAGPVEEIVVPPLAGEAPGV